MFSMCWLQVSVRLIYVQYQWCLVQTYLEMAQELVVDENILLQTLGMLIYILLIQRYNCDSVTC